MLWVHYLWWGCGYAVVGCNGYIITCGVGVGMLWKVVAGTLPVVGEWVYCGRL